MDTSMEASASASSNEAIDNILKTIQTILEKQSPSESEIDNLRKVIADQQQLGIVIYYFFLFPQDYDFDAERLIDLWIAEGFCNSSNDGRSCLSYLVGNSILQNVKKDELGQVGSCRMHPRLYNIANFVDSKRKNIMITKANPTGTIDDSNAVWRASFYSSNSQVPDELYSKAKQLKSIFFFNNTVELQEGKLDGILEKIFKNFEKLCVLELRNLGIKGVPSSIGDLKDLKYLDLSKNKMKKLPRSIAKLSNLHTLKLSDCHDLEKLPKDFNNLGKLKHLDIERCRGLTGMPKLSKLSSLQTLSAFVASKKETMGGLEELEKLNKLGGNLEILRLDRVRSSSFENMKTKFLLEKIEHLQRLTLSWNLEGDKKGDKDHLPLLESLKPHSKLRSLILVGFQGPSLPVWLTSLKRLVKLSLKDCHGREFKYLSEQDDQLPNLNILELVNLKFLEYITEKCNIEAVFYKSLKEMTIKNCPNLKSWWEKETEVPIFAKLSKLHVHGCPLQTMPHYPSLDEEMVLRSCTFDLLRLNTESIPLKNLRIQECSDLTNLSGVFKHLSSLQCLTIENCDKISLDGERNAWEGLKSLSFLKLKGIGELSSLSFGDGVTTLKELTLENCHKLTSILDSIGQVTSLRSLEISKCNKLESLPKTIFKSLQTLQILDCEHLQRKFVQETGEYWPLISGITDPQVKRTLQG